DPIAVDGRQPEIDPIELEAGHFLPLASKRYQHDTGGFAENRVPSDALALSIVRNPLLSEGGEQANVRLSGDDKGDGLLLHGARFASPAALVIALVCARLGWLDAAVAFSLLSIAILAAWLW